MHCLCCGILPTRRELACVRVCIMRKYPWGELQNQCYGRSPHLARGRLAPLNDDNADVEMQDKRKLEPMPRRR
eukprot:6512516-Prymnesium_polylepis.1